jgi:cell division protein FtsW
MLASVTALLGLGAVMIFSATSRGDGPLISVIFLKQMLYVAVGVAVALYVAGKDYHLFIRGHYVILGLAAVLLILVLFCPPLNGAKRWLRLGPISFQPSEMGKLAVIVFLAAFLGKRQNKIRSFNWTLVSAMLVVCFISALIFREPDLGTTALLCAVTWIVLFVAGAYLPYLIVPAVVAIPTVVLLVKDKEYVIRRWIAFWDPWKDAKGMGYHIIQSLTAVGSGGVRGVGLGHSTQKLSFLPESSSDFIFAILAEELGLIGGTLVVLAYIALIWAGVCIARRAKDIEGCLLATGITAMIALQAMINIGVVTKALPTKGIPLPFVSAGGSAVVFTLISIGILYSISRYSQELNVAIEE